MRAWAIVAALVGGGCVEQTELLRRNTAARIGCAPAALVVVDVQRRGSRPYDWTVRCEQRTWDCRNRWGRVTCVAR